MKLQYLTASAFVLLGLASLACSSGDDDIFMGGDGGGSGGTESSGAGTASSTAGSKTGGTGSGGGSSTAGTGQGGGSSAGTASGGEDSGGTGMGGGSGYDPCAGKACGDLCSPCDPKNGNCIAPAVEMTCTANGQCSIGRPACTIPSCEGDQKYYAPGCDAVARPSKPLLPFEPGCYDACSSAGTCPDGFTCTAVWTDPSASCPPGEGCLAACGAAANICLEG